MTDDAYERLAQRNAELEGEKAALAEELERAQSERDAAIKRAQVAEDEKDAVSSKCAEFKQDGEQWKSAHDEVAACEQVLAAHVEEWRKGIALVEGWANSDAEGNKGDAQEWLRHLRNWIGDHCSDDGPTTYLARLKAQWHAEALETVAMEPVFRGLPRHHLRERAGRIRRQAEEANAAGEGE